MNAFLPLALLLAAAPCMAQPTEAPYPVRPGERVRVTLTSDGRIGGTGGTGSTSVTGRVRTVGADSLALSGRSSARSTVAWADVARLDRATQNHTGEAIGLLAVGVLGCAVGFAGGFVYGSDWLAPIACVPVGVVGMLVGGVVGAHAGNGWRVVPSAGRGLRLVVPMR